MRTVEYYFLCVLQDMRPGTSSNLSASFPTGVKNLECVFCASRYLSMKDLVFHLAATHKIDKSKTSSSAANQQSGAIRIENIVSVLFLVFVSHVKQLNHFMIFKFMFQF